MQQKGRRREEGRGKARQARTLWGDLTKFKQTKETKRCRKSRVQQERERQREEVSKKYEAGRRLESKKAL